MPGTVTCFSYQGNEPPGTRGRTNSTCFSYSPDVPPGAANGGPARPPLPGMRRVPLICYGYPHSCFDYPGDVPPDAESRSAARRTPSALYRMPFGTCYRY
jgi:hypothetical protein